MVDGLPASAVNTLVSTLVTEVERLKVKGSGVAPIADTPFKIYYFPVKGRAFAQLVMLEGAGINYEWNKIPKNTWKDVKPRTYFGHTPFAEHGPVRIAQSMAITHYIARLGGIEGETPADYAMSEMLICQGNEIFEFLFDAAHPPADATEKQKADLWETCMTEQVPGHLKPLEPMMISEDKFTSTLTAGELLLFANLHSSVDLEPKLLEP